MSLRMVGARITAAAGASAGSDLVVNLHGDRVLPGLINAHDHLQLNTLPPLESNKRYGHAHEWIRDVDSRRRTRRSFRSAGRRAPQRSAADRWREESAEWCDDCGSPRSAVSLSIGRGLPDAGSCRTSAGRTRLYIDGEAAGARFLCATPPRISPWIIHAAEGYGCRVGRRVRPTGRARLHPRQHSDCPWHRAGCDRRRRVWIGPRRASIWCPSSNLRLFGRTAEVERLIEQRARSRLGTDSRLSGARDLLGRAAGCAGVLRAQ